MELRAIRQRPAVRPIVALGLDPGFAAFGWAALDLEGTVCLDASVIRTAPFARPGSDSRTMDNVRRTLEIRRALTAVLARFDVRALCVESFQHLRNASASAKVALAWGVIISLSAERSIPLLQASPQEIKVSVSGARTASKEDLAHDVRKRVGDMDGLLEAHTVLEDLYNHAYDAAAAALTCLTPEVVRGLQ